jgi:hypothetical protein
MSNSLISETVVLYEQAYFLGEGSGLGREILTDWTKISIEYIFETIRVTQYTFSPIHIHDKFVIQFKYGISIENLFSFSKTEQIKNNHDFHQPLIIIHKSK